MCLSSVYMSSGNGQKEIMKDVVRMEAEGGGFWLINLLGERKYVEGAIENVSLMDGYVVMNENHRAA